MFYLLDKLKPTLINWRLHATYLSCFQVGSVVVGLVEEVDELFSKKDKEREATIFENLPMREEPRIWIDLIF